MIDTTAFKGVHFSKAQIEAFFTKRFWTLPEYDKLYFSEWEHRFKCLTRDFEKFFRIYFDTESQEVLYEVVTGHPYYGNADGTFKNRAAFEAHERKHGRLSAYQGHRDRVINFMLRNGTWFLAKSELLD